MAFAPPSLSIVRKNKSSTTSAPSASQSTPFKPRRLTVEDSKDVATVVTATLPATRNSRGSKAVARDSVRSSSFSSSSSTSSSPTSSSSSSSSSPPSPSLSFAQPPASSCATFPIAPSSQSLQSALSSSSNVASLSPSSSSSSNSSSTECLPSQPALSSYSAILPSSSLLVSLDSSASSQSDRSSSSPGSSTPTSVPSPTSLSARSSSHSRSVKINSPPPSAPSSGFSSLFQSVRARLPFGLSASSRSVSGDSSVASSLASIASNSPSSTSPLSSSTTLSRSSSAADSLASASSSTRASAPRSLASSLRTSSSSHPSSASITATASPSLAQASFYVCTFALHGPQFIRQPLYECMDCGFAANACLCEPCVLRCHAGHRIKPIQSNSNITPAAFCDCGEMHSRTMIKAPAASSSSLPSSSLPTPSSSLALPASSASASVLPADSSVTSTSALSPPIPSSSVALGTSSARRGAAGHICEAFTPAARTIVRRLDAVCTRRRSGPKSSILQLLFVCLTCDPTSSKSLCENCALLCHATHELQRMWHKNAGVCKCGTKNSGNPENECFALRIDSDAVLSRLNAAQASFLLIDRDRSSNKTNTSGGPSLRRGKGRTKGSSSSDSGSFFEENSPTDSEENEFPSVEKPSNARSPGPVVLLSSSTSASLQQPDAVAWPEVRKSSTGTSAEPSADGQERPPHSEERVSTLLDTGGRSESGSSPSNSSFLISSNSASTQFSPSESGPVVILSARSNMDISPLSALGGSSSPSTTPVAEEDGPLVPQRGKTAPVARSSARSHVAPTTLHDILSELDLRQYQPIFEENALDVHSLSLLDDATWQRLVPKHGHRVRLMSHLDRIRFPNAPSLTNNAAQIEAYRSVLSEMIKSATVSRRDQSLLSTLRMNSPISLAQHTQVLRELGVTAEKWESMTSRGDKAESSGNEASSNCVVCLCEAATVIILPCGHLCLCPECALKFGNKSLCPKCRSVSESIRRVYI